MRVIEVGKQKAGEGRMGGVNRSLGKLAPSKNREAENAQATVINLFSKILDNRFLLLQGVRLQGFDGLPPLVLVGPPGIWVIEASPVSGMFRAGPESWEEMDSRAHNFRMARPNIPQRLLAISKALESFLTSSLNTGAVLPPLEPVVLFTHPGAHLELQQPSVRLVPADAIGRFAAGLLKERVILERVNIQAIADILDPSAAIPAQAGPGDDGDSGEPEVKPSKAPNLPSIPEQEPDVVKRISRYTDFSRFQWIVLAGLALMVVLVLIAVILLLLTIT